MKLPDNGTSDETTRYHKNSTNMDVNEAQRKTTLQRSKETRAFVNKKEKQTNTDLF